MILIELRVIKVPTFAAFPIPSAVIKTFLSKLNVKNSL